MRFLRVLDLEDTLELKDHHLDDIGQLLHLKYLSLRGCRNILCLPNSLQNLRHLEMLDVRGTHIYELFRGYFFLRPQVLDVSPNRYDIFNLYRFQEMKLDGVILPRGIGKLKALHALGVVDVSWKNGNTTIKELGMLTQLRKLKVGGLSYRNINELWSAIAGHNQLRSLSVEIGDLLEERNELDGCLGEGLLPPSSLESLALLGKLVNVTGWIHKLQNLTKLVLDWSRLKQNDDAIQALGVLPNIAVLCLRAFSFEGRQLHFQRSSFPSLMVLELIYLSKLQAVLFEEDTMPKLELLQIYLCQEMKDISRLPALKSLKEIRLRHSENVKEEVERQVAEHMKHVRLNIIDRLLNPPSLSPSLFPSDS